MVYFIAGLLVLMVLLVCQLCLWYAGEAEFWRQRYLDERWENRA